MTTELTRGLSWSKKWHILDDSGRRGQLGTSLCGEPWQAQDDARNFEADGYRARVMRVTVADDGRPVAEWMDWPDHGLYRVFWKSGGSSLASIGVTSDGGRWLAPINWVKPSDDFIEWDRIDRLERIHVDPE